MRLGEERLAREKQEKARHMLTEVEKANKLNVARREEKKQQELAEDEARFRHV